MIQCEEGVDDCLPPYWEGDLYDKANAFKEYSVLER